MLMHAEDMADLKLHLGGRLAADVHQVLDGELPPLRLIEESAHLACEQHAARSNMTLN